MNFLRRCWQRRWMRGLIWTAVTLVTLYALLYAWVNWSGARRWRATQAMLKGEGETLDFRATLKEPVPEAENFCAIPLLKDLALVVDNDPDKGAPAEKRRRLAALALRPASKDPGLPAFASLEGGRRTDFKAWADWLRKDGSLQMPANSGDAARDVLAALAKHNEEMRELASGLHRTKAQWTPEWKIRELPEPLIGAVLPDLRFFRDVNGILALRATAAARVGDAAKAHESALISARINLAFMNDPFLHRLVFGALGMKVLCGTTWELCDAHSGTAEEFAKLESSLAALDFHGALLSTFRSELAAIVDTMQGCKSQPAEIAEFLLPRLRASGIRGDGSALLMRAIPSGFFDASSAVLAELEYRHNIKPMKEPGWQTAREAGRLQQSEMTAKKKSRWMHPSDILASVAVPAMNYVVNEAIYTQTLINQAVIACALERHRIEKGSYPDSLDAVRLADGKPLPSDPMDDKPMRYRKTADGQYALWSVGLDGKDDGGKRVLDGKKPENTRFNDETYVGDWVWDFPAE